MRHAPPAAAAQHKSDFGARIRTAAFVRCPPESRAHAQEEKTEYKRCFIRVHPVIILYWTMRHTKKVYGLPANGKSVPSSLRLC
jgi:hypothetical protein